MLKQIFHSLVKLQRQQESTGGRQGRPPSRQTGLNISKPNLEDDIFPLCNKISSQSNKNITITTMKTFQLMKHARLFQNILGIPRMIKKPGNFGKSRAFSENARLFLQTTKT